MCREWLPSPHAIQVQQIPLQGLMKVMAIISMERLELYETVNYIEIELMSCSKTNPQRRACMSNQTNEVCTMRKITGRG